MNEIQTDFLTEQGKITYLGLLDLRHLRSVDELRNVTEISYVGTILISDQLEGSIHNIPMHYVGSVVSIPSDMKVKVLSGDLKLHGDFLENEGGDPEETLLVTGGLIITSPFQKVGYKSLILTGEIFAPKECEYVLTSSISQLYGELHCYESEPRMFSGQDRFGHDFFFYLKKPVTLILRGNSVLRLMFLQSCYMKKYLRSFCGETFKRRIASRLRCYWRLQL